jgi:hypothetical protein
VSSLASGRFSIPEVLMINRGGRGVAMSATALTPGYPLSRGMTTLRAGRYSQEEAGYGFAAGSLPAVS